MRVDGLSGVSIAKGARHLVLLTAVAAMLGGAAPITLHLPGSDVVVRVTDLRSHDGVIRACMTSDHNKFPRCTRSGSSFRTVTPAAGDVTLTFQDIPPGRYAIALLHDENGNGKADRALTMIPREGFGFSRDAPVQMGPPSFDAAAFQVRQQDVRQTIRMRYML